MPSLKLTTRASRASNRNLRKDELAFRKREQQRELKRELDRQEMQRTLDLSGRTIQRVEEMRQLLGLELNHDPNKYVFPKLEFSPEFTAKLERARSEASSPALVRSEDGYDYDYTLAKRHNGLAILRDPESAAVEPTWTPDRFVDYVVHVHDPLEFIFNSYNAANPIPLYELYARIRCAIRGL